MYLKLGSSNINYSSTINDFMIVSEIVDSGMSYEKPILVRSIDELDIWFGKNFQDRDYLEELIKEGVTLFLYRPIKGEENIYSDDYIDLSVYKLDDNLYESMDLLPKNGQVDVLYKVVSNDGEYLDKNTNLTYTYYIYISDLEEYVRVSELPQNMNSNNTISLNNRDTLNLGYVGYKGPDYSYPIYRENDNKEVEDYTEDIDEELLLSHLPDLDRVLNKYDTLGFLLYFNENLNFKPEDELGLNTKYIILSKLDVESNLYKRILFWFKDENNVIPSISSSYYDEQISISVKDKTTDDIKKIFINEILISNLNYNVELVENNNYKIYTSYNLPVTYFYNISGLELEPRIDITHNILSKLLKNNTRIKFYSKTIGSDISDSTDNNININIEKLKEKDSYRITVSRFDYYEVFEGGLFTTDGKRIDDIISSESKLVYCDLVNTYIDNSGIEKQYKLDFTDTDRNSELPEGNWDLRRAVKEDYDIDMYWKSLNTIMGSDNTVYMDFFLVPDTSKYIGKLNPDYSYYYEYQKFLELSTNFNCQFLIQNSDNGWNYEKVEEIPENLSENIVYIYKEKYYILSNGKLVETIDPEIINTYGNNFVFNYTEDMDNRLVYFFRSMKIYGKNRPGYFLHLFGLLSDIYSLTSNIVIYECPTKYPYELEDIELVLEKYKSNYLVFNNHIYFYKKYQNGEFYNTSIWFRFCIGKVYRELEKHKWEILSKKTTGEIREKINNILIGISNSFSFINSLSLVELNPDLENNRLELKIESKMSNLVDNNMTIDIVLYYNKSNN